MLHQLEKQRIRELAYLAQGMSLEDAMCRAFYDFPVRIFVPEN